MLNVDGPELLSVIWCNPCVQSCLLGEGDSTCCRHTLLGWERQPTCLLGLGRRCIFCCLDPFLEVVHPVNWSFGGVLETHVGPDPCPFLYAGPYANRPVVDFPPLFRVVNGVVQGGQSNESSENTQDNGGSKVEGISTELGGFLIRLFLESLNHGAEKAVGRVEVLWTGGSFGTHGGRCG